MQSGTPSRTLVTPLKLANALRHAGSLVTALHFEALGIGFGMEKYSGTGSGAHVKHDAKDDSECSLQHE